MTPWRLTGLLYYFRLIHEAILSFAVDPITGKIDMDLINTGRSNTQRKLLSMIKNFVIDSINSTEGQGMNYANILGSFKETNKVQFIYFS